MKYARYSKKDSKSPAIQPSQKGRRIRMLLLLGFGLIVVAIVGSYLKNRATKGRENAEQELFDIQLQADKICLQYAITMLAHSTKYYYIKESFVDPEFEFNALEHKFHSECAKLKLDVTKRVFKKIADNLNESRYDMIRRRRELNDVFLKGTDAEKIIQRDYIANILEIDRNYLEGVYMGALGESVFDE